MWYMWQCDGGNRSNAAVLCGALDAELQQMEVQKGGGRRNQCYVHERGREYERLT